VPYTAGWNLTLVSDILGKMSRAPVAGVAHLAGVASPGWGGGAKCTSEGTVCNKDLVCASGWGVAVQQSCPGS